MRLSFSGMMMRKRSRSKATFSIYRNAAVTLQRQTPDSILFSVCLFQFVFFLTSVLKLPYFPSLAQAG